MINNCTAPAVNYQEKWVEAFVSPFSRLGNEVHTSFSFRNWIRLFQVKIADENGGARRCSARGVGNEEVKVGEQIENGWESDRTNGTNTSVSQMHPYVPASTDHRLFIPSHTRRPRSIHSPVSSLFLILKLLSTALLNNSMCCVEHVFESGLFRWFSEKF